MTYRILIRGLAERDLEEASGWYDQQRMGLGAEFLDAVRELTRRLAENPASYPFVHKETRRAVLRRFPYVLYFSIQHSTIVVLACLHSSRHPRVHDRRSR